VLASDGASVALDGPPIALLAASDALWALDANGTLYRIEDGRIASRSDLDLQARDARGRRARADRDARRRAVGDRARHRPAAGRSAERARAGDGRDRRWRDAGGALWVPARSEAVDATGFPTMDALRRVVPGGAATVVARPRAKTDVHGLIADEDGVWLADTTAGFVYRYRNP